MSEKDLDMGLPEDVQPEMIQDAVGQIKLAKTDRRQAKKTYKCRVCGENIYPGTVYLHQAWKDEDGMHYYKQHDEGGCW